MSPEEVKVTIARHETDIEYLKTCHADIKHELKSVNAKLDSFKMWVMGIMSGIILTFLAHFLQ